MFVQSHKNDNEKASFFYMKHLCYLFFLSLFILFFSAAVMPDRIERNNRVTIDSNGNANVHYYREIKLTVTR